MPDFPDLSCVATHSKGGNQNDGQTNQQQPQKSPQSDVEEHDGLERWVMTLCENMSTSHERDEKVNQRPDDFTMGCICLALRFRDKEKVKQVKCRADGAEGMFEIGIRG